MSSILSRRSFLVASGTLPAALSAHVTMSSGTFTRHTGADDATEPDEAFPAQDAASVREIVGVSHGNFDRVRELVEARPALAKASWDWGFGDWESALGAAAHTGNRDIAAFLIEHGARPNMFSAAMLGQLDVVRAFIEASPGVQRIPGPHGISLLTHARAGGEQASEVYAYLEALGDADVQATNEPLAEEKLQELLGNYRFGTGEDDVIVISERRGMLRLARGEGGIARTLYHQGDLTFEPAGAQGVRIRFTIEDNGTRTVTIIDPEPIVTATAAAG